MKAKINLQLLKTTTFDSAALGAFAMVIHQFCLPGRYRATIMNESRAITDVSFVVDEKSEVMQLDIDLAKNIKSPLGDCNCKEVRTEIGVSPKGYVLFHVSSGYGYSVIVINEEEKIVFDSTKLNNGDLFAVSLLEPATYSMTNTISGAKGEITVSLTPDAAKQLKSLETCYIEVNKKIFNIECVELTSSQGLVFHIKDSARIFIEKKQTTSKAMSKHNNKQLISWKKIKAAI